MNNRDNFTKITIDILAKRVGYICSNPKCRTHTIGPNEKIDKATSIGIAAHISAASPGGPRYDASLSQDQRVHSDNGIWLCSNCATLIDKDPDRFPVFLLKQWKEGAEFQMQEKLLGKGYFSGAIIKPYLEADLIWNGAGRSNRGYSPKNPTIIENGAPIMTIDHSFGPPIIFWEIRRDFRFVINNNSSVPAYNIQVEEIGTVKFNSMSKLARVNNLPPFQSLDLDANFTTLVEGTYLVADQYLASDIPSNLDGWSMRITFQDEERNILFTNVHIKNQTITNTTD
jgi:hypothetical protein